MIAANGRAIVSVNLPPEERGRALGLTSTAFHIGFLTGPSLGRFSDRYHRLALDILYQHAVQPVGRLFGVEGHSRDPTTRKNRRRYPRRLAIACLTNGLFIYAIDQLPRVGWHHPMFLLTLSLSIVALFFLLRVEAKAKTPILILSMFRSRLFSGGHLKSCF